MPSEIADLEATAQPSETVPEKMTNKGWQTLMHNGREAAKRQFSIQTRVTLPKLKFMDGSDA